MTDLEQIGDFGEILSRHDLELGHFVGFHSSRRIRLDVPATLHLLLWVPRCRSPLGVRPWMDAESIFPMAWGVLTQVNNPLNACALRFSPLAIERDASSHASQDRGAVAMCEARAMCAAPSTGRPCMRNPDHASQVLDDLS
jgi:hypothetical protein